METINFLRGDATKPVVSTGETAIIAHIVNSSGGWGRGFVLAITRNLGPYPEKCYRLWAAQGEGARVPFRLGQIQLVPLGTGLFVANLLAQEGYSRPGSPAIRYEALRSCLEELGERARALNASVHMPRIGTGLAGGDWNIIEPIISNCLCAQGVSVTVYDLA